MVSLFLFCTFHQAYAIKILKHVMSIVQATPKNQDGGDHGA